MKLDDTICYCFHITKRKIVNFIRIHRPRRASQINQCGGAGSGCGWCIPYLKKYFAQMQEGNLDQVEEDITPEEYAQMRARYIRSGKGTPAEGAVPLPPEDSRSEESSNEDTSPSS